VTVFAPLKAPFPAFGGKSKIAADVWARLGDVHNYVEPCVFSGAMLLRRPEPGPVETINDLNAYVSNFWRAVRADPDAVAYHADYPVIETDLHARHRWLVGSDAARATLELVRSDPDAYDAKVAGWWCWGACCWIGSGWCDSDAAGGTLSTPCEKRPRMDTGRGINSGGALPDETHRPQLADAYSRGRGVNGHDAASTTDARRAWVTEWMRALGDRLRPVRVCCGHWARVCDSPSTMTRLGLTGVFLDPPYRKHLADGTRNRSDGLYANDRAQDVGALCDEVEEWCLRWGAEPEVRIALCGLEGEYPGVEAAGWTVEAWKSGGGYGNQSGIVNVNSHRERVWYSPACLRGEAERGLFGGAT